MLALKIICLVICAGLLFICYRPKQFAEKVLKKSDADITDKLILKIKAIALAISIIIFVLTIIFIR